jgi:hypothetical protein
MAVSIVASIDQVQSGLDADCDFTPAGWTPAADDVVVFWCASQNANATIVVPTGRGYPLGGNTIVTFGAPRRCLSSRRVMTSRWICRAISHLSTFDVGADLLHVLKHPS